jgi:hypothetical protein
MVHGLKEELDLRSKGIINGPTEYMEPTVDSDGFLFAERIPALREASFDLEYVVKNGSTAEKATDKPKRGLRQRLFGRK